MKFEDKYPEVARPYCACFVLLRRKNKIAMVLRKNTTYMDGYYGLPAGKSEWFEPFSVGAAREAREEAGIDINLAHLRFVHIAHRHGVAQIEQKFMDWVDVYFEADHWNGEPYNAEEHKAEHLEWLDLDNLPENIVPPQRAALEYIRDGVFYSEFGWDDPENS